MQLNLPGARIMALEFTNDASKTLYFWCDPLYVLSTSCSVAVRRRGCLTHVYLLG